MYGTAEQNRDINNIKYLQTQLSWKYKRKLFTKVSLMNILRYLIWYTNCMIQNNCHLDHSMWKIGRKKENNKNNKNTKLQGKFKMEHSLTSCNIKSSNTSNEWKTTCICLTCYMLSNIQKWLIKPGIKARKTSYLYDFRVKFHYTDNVWA